MNAFAMLLLILLAANVACDNDAFISMLLEQSSTTSPSRLLTTYISIGRPEKRYLVVVDFERNEIDLNLCMRERSYTFDVTELDNRTSDIVLFVDDTLVEPVKRGIYRLPIREHCASDEPFTYLPCLTLDKCAGVLGLGPLSPLWIKWSSVTIAHNALHFGESNPRREARKDERIRCAGALDERLCQFPATLAGRNVTVDFHSNDSYIYVPADIYRYYAEERNLYGFTNAQRRAALRVDARRQKLIDALHNHDNTTTHLARHRNMTRAAFSERLRADHEVALAHSTYYRSTHDVTDLAEWPPLVLLPLSVRRLRNASHHHHHHRRQHDNDDDEDAGTHNLVVLEYDLLVFSPLFSGTYGRRARSSSTLPFAGMMDSTRTLMLRPFADASITDRVSLGNVFFRHYRIYKDVVHNTLEITERFSCDNLSDVEVLGGLYLYAYFIFSVCRVMWYSVTLTMSLNRRCPVCNEAMSPYAPHRVPPSFLVLLGIAGDALLIGISVWSLVHIEAFLREAAAEMSELAVNFVTWSWLMAAPNILVVLFVLIGTPGQHAPPDGTFCWRTFRWTIAKAACSEQVALLGLLWMSLILQTDTLGTSLSVFIAALLFFSASHHFVHLVLFEQDFGTTLLHFVRRVSPQSIVSRPAPISVPFRPHTGSFPDADVNTVWFAFSLLLLFLLNVVFTTVILLRYIVLPAVSESPWMACLLYAFAFLAAMWLLDTYEREAVRKTQFSPVVY